MINPQHIIKYVIRPTLEHLGMYSEAAENLLIGTAMHESELEALHQKHGPAIGLWQMEPTTHYDLWEIYIDGRHNIKSLVRQLAGAKYIGMRLDPDEMHGNLNYACAMARITYYRHSEPLPDKDDIEGLGRYYKKYFNSELGKATPQDFVNAYNKVIA